MLFFKFDSLCHARPWYTYTTMYHAQLDFCWCVGELLCAKMSFVQKNCEKYDYVIFVWKWSNEVHKIYGRIAKVSMMAELLVYYIIPWPGMSEMMISWCYICYVTLRNLFCKANVKISAFLWFLFLRLPCNQMHFLDNISKKKILKHWELKPKPCFIFTEISNKPILLIIVCINGYYMYLLLKLSVNFFV